MRPQQIIPALAVLTLTATGILGGFSANEHETGAEAVVAGGQPMVETHELAGKIGCSIGGVVMTTDWCRPRFMNDENPGIDPESMATFYLVPDQPDESISAALFVLSWTPTVPQLADKLSLRWTPGIRSTATTNGEPYLYQSGAWNSAKGTSSLWVREGSSEAFGLYYPNRFPESPLRLDAFAAGTQFIGPPPFVDTEDLARAAIDQPFSLCVTFAYNGAQLPAPACPAP